MSAPRSITVFTRHAPGGEPGRGLRRLAELARDAGIALRVPQAEVDKHGLAPVPGVELGADPDGPTDLAMALGGDGTILAALRHYAGTAVPVFAINFGEIGFLSTVERDGLDAAIAPALRGDFEVLPLPALEVGTRRGRGSASTTSRSTARPDLRVAELSYGVGDEQVGPGPLRRARHRHPGGLDRLQPRQRRAGDGVGRRGLRRVVHRPAHAVGAARWSWRPTTCCR